jgi:hypothetical protein
MRDIRMYNYYVWVKLGLVPMSFRGNKAKNRLNFTSKWLQNEINCLSLLRLIYKNYATSIYDGEDGLTTETEF